MGNRNRIEYSLSYKSNGGQDMAAATLDPCNVMAQNFSRRIEAALNAIQLQGKLIAVYPILFFLLYRCGRIRRHIRLSMVNCDSDCSKRTECTKWLCKSSIEIRDNMARLYTVSLESWLLIPFRYNLEKALVEWDDFVDECKLTSDTEVRDLIACIADAA